ncbi:(S)-ureidoglycine aminohydrolase [Roseovarius sp. A21]|uniref:(S)-ureidoglycine aminohydrolase n=1 Tax=Roseovarius bejariae TaxID=2576383 RepID=A0A844CKE1_9RHOB|nr:bifunctional allantoicase/(S)-ureidoglycine aminohydrolase [Roseovarius bejariae]MRU13955.1 (S)-ureidoglycine aminohydrolase [Roseovarius bejariae]
MSGNFTYYAPKGGLPDQTTLTQDRARFTSCYAVMPRRVLSDITMSRLPGWQNTRAWVLARPMSGFAETFAQLILDVAPGGGSNHPEPDPMGQGVLFGLEGVLRLSIDGVGHDLGPGGYAYIAPGANWSVENTGQSTAKVVWVRKRYQPAPGLDAPESFVTSDTEHEPDPMPDTDGIWATTRFVDNTDLRHDMHVNIVTFRPGGTIPFAETHVMEHGIYILQGRAVYLLNQDWVEVEAGDFLWLRAFCPQACYAAGSEPFRYLLYKDVNRHADLMPLKGG